MGNIYNWTNDQKECIHEAVNWYKYQEKQVFQYGGWAGVGKTTIVPEIIRKMRLDMGEVLAIAFTGKAASNLSLKGIPAVSAHSALMENIQVPKTDREGNIIRKNGMALMSWAFERKKSISKNTKLMFIDEGYFFPNELGIIAESFGIPICVCGDPGQLGPVYGKPRYLIKPDYFINEITRQGNESGIIELATLIRKGEQIPRKKTMFKNDAFIIPKEEMTDELLKNVDIILCGKNITRNYFNTRIRREILGINSRLPIKGDKVICRFNYWQRTLDDIPLTNGVIGHIIHDITNSSIDLKSGIVKIDFMPDYTDNNYYVNLPIDIKYFQEECGMHDNNDYRYRTGIKMELSHAITTHISQGSDFDNVLYYDEQFGDSDSIRRLRYTGVTRAKNIVIFVV